MRFAKTFASLIFVGTIAAGTSVSAQCQRGGQGSPGNNALAGATPYSLNQLNTGYNQNSLNPTGYTQSTLASMVANDQYIRNMRYLNAQAQSQAVRSQVAQAQSMRKEMMKASAEMRKAAQKEKAENLALREERESAKEAKNYESKRSTTRLASIQ